MMSSEFNQQELEACLAQCLKCGGLREILAKAGIPENEPVTLSIKSGDIEVIDLITDYEIPITNPLVPVIPTEIDFDQEIRDFLNQAESCHDLLSLLPPSEKLSDGTIKNPFQLDFKPSSMTSQKSSGCVCGNPRRTC
jgi:hypothetical protein